MLVLYDLYERIPRSAIAAFIESAGLTFGRLVPLGIYILRKVAWSKHPSKKWLLPMVTPFQAGHSDFEKPITWSRLIANHRSQKVFISSLSKALNLHALGANYQGIAPAGVFLA